jgi:hypothetical protein
MPDNARPWVHPVPVWALPDSTTHVENESHSVNHNIHQLASGTAGRALPARTMRDSHTHGNRVDRSGNSETVGRATNGNKSSMASPVGGGESRGHDKIKQSFKCPRFSGNAKDWKIWHKGFVRFLSIWDLDYVLDPSFFDDFPLSVQKIHDNKMVYFILEDATQGSPLAASYVRQAPVKNGFEAYYTLHDGFVFAGSRLQQFC